LIELLVKLSRRIGHQIASVLHRVLSSCACGFSTTVRERIRCRLNVASTSWPGASPEVDL
jgi:hypothetical protein